LREFITDSDPKTILLYACVNSESTCDSRRENDWSHGGNSETVVVRPYNSGRDNDLPGRRQRGLPQLADARMGAMLIRGDEKGGGRMEEPLG
jgi:hypothetical protein